MGLDWKFGLFKAVGTKSAANSETRSTTVVQLHVLGVTDTQT